MTDPWNVQFRKEGEECRTPSMSIHGVNCLWFDRSPTELTINPLHEGTRDRNNRQALRRSKTTYETGGSHLSSQGPAVAGRRQSAAMTDKRSMS